MAIPKLTLNIQNGNLESFKMTRQVEYEDEQSQDYFTKEYFRDYADRFATTKYSSDKNGRKDPNYDFQVSTSKLISEDEVLSLIYSTSKMNFASLTINQDGYTEHFENNDKAHHKLSEVFDILSKDKPDLIIHAQMHERPKTKNTKTTESAPAIVQQIGARTFFLN